MGDRIMLGKLALTALIFGIVWMLVSRGTRGTRETREMRGTRGTWETRKTMRTPFRRRTKPVPPAELLVECPACGACRPAGAPCPCRTDG